MNSAFIKDLLKLDTSLGIEKFYCGKTDYKYGKSICVYDLESQARRNIAVGGSDLTTGKNKFTILIRWNKSYSETEDASQRIYDYLTNLNGSSYINIDINYVEMLNERPIDLHCGDDGIYERTIDILVHYKEK